MDLDGDPPLEDEHEVVHSQLPEIATSLEAMTITPTKEIRVRLQQSPETATVQTTHNLLMKVGHSGGQQRQIPLEALKKPMAKAWQRVYLDISQVESNLFMAHFRNYEDLSWVWQKQPWSFGSDVFLLEWVSLDEKIKPMSAYTFKHLMVNVRIYGIPPSLRNVKNVKLAAENIGQISKAEPIDPDSLLRNQKFVCVRIRIDVEKPVPDHVILELPDKSELKAFLHYERTPRICTFCGLLFHNVQVCPQRQRIIIQFPDAFEEDLKDKLGKWITQIDYMPSEAFLDMEESNKNSIVEKFRQHFSSPQFKNIQEQQKQQERGSGTSQSLMPKLDWKKASEKALTLAGCSTVQGPPSQAVHTTTAGKQCEKKDKEPDIQSIPEVGTEEMLVHGSTEKKKLVSSTIEDHVSCNSKNVNTAGKVHQMEPVQSVPLVHRVSPSASGHQNSLVNPAIGTNKVQHRRSTRATKIYETASQHLSKKRGFHEAAHESTKRHCSPTTSAASSFSIVGGEEHGGIESRRASPTNHHSAPIRVPSRRGGQRATRWDQRGGYGGGMVTSTSWRPLAAAHSDVFQRDAPRSPQSINNFHSRKHTWSALEAHHDIFVDQAAGDTQGGGASDAGASSRLILATDPRECNVSEIQLVDPSAGNGGDGSGKNDGWAMAPAHKASRAS